MLIEILEGPTLPSEKTPERSIVRRSFLFIALIQLIGEFTANIYLKALKPIPIILLMVLISTKNKQTKFIFYGLASSLAGDLALMIRNEVVFQIGAGAFLIAHVFYIWAFCLDINFAELVNLSKWRVSRLFLLCNVVIMVYILNVNALWEKTSNLILFIVYGFILTVMVICALMRAGTVKGKFYWYVSCGALFFGISDHLLAFLKFNHYHTDIGEGIIMVTYYLAQYFIVRGIWKWASREK